MTECANYQRSATARGSTWYSKEGLRWYLNISWWKTGVIEELIGGTTHTQSAGQPPRNLCSFSQCFMKESEAAWWSAAKTQFAWIYYAKSERESKNSIAQAQWQTIINSKYQLLLLVVAGNCRERTHWSLPAPCPSRVKPTFWYPIPSEWPPVPTCCSDHCHINP